MSTPITDRITRPLPEPAVQQAKPAQNKRAEQAALTQQQLRAAQEAKANASRNADKGQHVDRYA